MNPTEFANLIRTKYPGSYDNVSDLELTQKVIMKYPTYASKVKMPEAPKKDLLQKTTNIVGKVFPGQKVGESIGTAIASGIQALKGNKEEALDIAATAPKPLAVGADIVSGALNVGLMKGVGATGKFGERVLKMAGIGAGLSGSEAIKEGGDVGDVAKSAAAGGVLGAAMPVAGAGLRAIGRQIEALPARLVNSALGRSKPQIMKDIATDKVDDFAKYVTQNKPIGTANKLFSDSVDSVESLSHKISSALENAARQTGSKVTIGRNNLLDTITKTPEAEGALLKRVDVKSIIERLAPQTKQLLNKESLTLTEANKLRQLVDRTLGDRAFLGAQLSSDKAVLKSFADVLREQVKTKAPQGTRALFAELANEIRFRDAMLNKIASGGNNNLISLSGILGGAIGSAVGGGIPGALGGVAAIKAIESVPFKIGAAKLTTALTRLEPVIEQLTPAQQNAILNFFADVFSQSDDDQLKSQSQ